MRNVRAKKGFTLAETLTVAAIVVALAALIVVLVINYLRSMIKLEYDGYAQSIFVAAQNHLTMAEHEGYLGRTGFGNKETTTPTTGGDTGNGPATPSLTQDGVYYFIVVDADEFQNANSILDLILPFGSVDETVRAGKYIIRYHKDSAQVMDVFYWSDTGRFKHTPASITLDEYKDLLSKKGEDNKSLLRTYTFTRDNSVIGWYGGVTAEGLTKGTELKPPTMTLVNAERLYVTVTNPNGSTGKLKLVVKGLLSKQTKELDLTGVDLSKPIILDDVTQAGKHFSELFPDFYPGEDITVYAVAYDDSTLTNVAFSSEQTTNSLFASVSDSDANDKPDTAQVSNFRHLENLDYSVSGVNEFNTDKILITNAEQTTDLDWDAFQAAVEQNPGAGASVYLMSGSLSKTTAGGYYPIGNKNTTTSLTYDGQNHSISNVTVKATDAIPAAGLFSNLTLGGVSDLKLIDFNVTGTSQAGALAGTVGSGVSVDNVLAINSGSGMDPTITALNAGGLIGKSSGSVTNSAAALVVSGKNDAGGLIGVADGGTVTGCYAGGHTEGAAYDEDKPNVYSSDGNAGGLIGSSAATVQYCYSTCSAQGVTAGGFVGTATAGSIKNSYCTGLVGGKDASSVIGAFAGSLTGDAGNYDAQYFSIINIGLAAVGNSTSYTDVTAFDSDTASYRAFVSAGSAAKDADPYDATLVGYYQGKYNLKTVAQLGASVSSTDFVAVHYGDWPAPEIFFINDPVTP